MRFCLARLAAVTFALLLGAGCSQLGDPASPQLVLTPAIKAADPVDTDWNLVTTKTVAPGTTTQVTGSRYTLTFEPLSTLDSLSVTIRERNASIIDVEFGPDGSQFYKPVLLEISYRGTVFDASAPNFSGRSPKLFWFNPATGNWENVPGTDDPKNSMYTVNLQHFSRYAMGDGTSGWEDAEGNRDKDSIK